LSQHVETFFFFPPFFKPSQLLLHSPKTASLLLGVEEQVRKTVCGKEPQPHNILFAFLFKKKNSADQKLEGQIEIRNTDPLSNFVF